MDNTQHKIECGFSNYIAIGFYFHRDFIGYLFQIIIPGFYINFTIPKGDMAKEYPWKLFRFNGYR